MKPLLILCATSPMGWLGRFAFAVAFGLLASMSASVADAGVYRWVDDQGTVHYAEVVPQRYQSVARRVGVTADEPTAEQRRDALDGARKVKDRAAGMATERQMPSSAPTAAAASRGAVKRPAQMPNDQTDCTTWQRLYLESIECFGPFRTARGATKPEAFEVCNVVTEPPPGRCRLLIP